MNKSNTQNPILFLSTLSLRRATARGMLCSWFARKFLSTLSLRRATLRRGPCHQRRYFYPRSPCGERLKIDTLSRPFRYFYPRSPCGERPSTRIDTDNNSDFYPRSPCGERRKGTAGRINSRINFYPRSPCGERHTYHRIFGEGE